MYKLFLIFYLFYCSLVYGSSDDDDITQYSTDDAPQSQDVIHSKNIFTNPPIVTDITSFVRIKVYCEIDSRFCNKVNHAFISAATQLSEVVLLKNRITFQASYYSFCINHCSNSTYGWGVPSSQFTLISLNEADENFIYPQPLAKQLAQVTNSSNWASDYDVAVDINHDIYMNNYVDDNWNGTGIPASGGYWFTNDSESIEDHQIDIEYVILHQMIHGLGMTTSWASYFYDAASPFHLLLKDVIEPEESLKVVTPNPHWRVPHDGGPVYITGFQPNLIFDKFLTLFFPAVNRTDSLAEIGFEMQNFCVQDDDTFIVNFMNSFLNNATQSYKAMSMFVSMSTPQTLKFQFVGTNAQSTYYTNNYLNKTYEYMQLYTGSNTSCQQGDYYQPGIVYTHLDQAYSSTPDFLMTGNYVQGKKLTSLIDEVYSNITITYNVTKLVNVTVYNKTTVNNYTTITNKTIEQGVTIETLYKSAIGPGVLRILETIGYSTVLTNTNYTADIIKSNKPKSTCSDNSNIGTDGSLSNNGNDDDTTTGSSSSAGSSSLSNNNSGASTSMGLIHNMNFYIHLCVMIITFIVL